MCKPETIIDAVMRLAETTDPYHAEQLYLGTLRWADDSFGMINTQSGTLLFALMDLYDCQERHEDSEQVQVRIRSIILSQAIQLGYI